MAPRLASPLLASRRCPAPRGLLCRCRLLPAALPAPLGLRSRWAAPRPWLRAAVPAGARAAVPGGGRHLCPRLQHSGDVSARRLSNAAPHRRHGADGSAGGRGAARRIPLGSSGDVGADGRHGSAEMAPCPARRWRSGPADTVAQRLGPPGCLRPSTGSHGALFRERTRRHVALAHPPGYPPGLGQGGGTASFSHTPHVGAQHFPRCVGAITPSSALCSVPPCCISRCSRSDVQECCWVV